MMPALSRLDNFFLQIETPRRPMHWALVLDLDADAGGAPLQLQELHARIAERVDRYRIFRLGITNNPGRKPILVDYPAAAVPGQCVSAVTVADRAGFDQLLSSLMAQPLSGDRPSWRVVLVDQLEPFTQRLVMLVHHAMSDGVAGAGYTALFADGDDDELRQLDRFVLADRFPSPSITAAEFGPAAKGLVSSWARAARAKRLPRLSKAQRRGVVAVQANTADVRRAAAAVGAGTSEYLVAAIGASVSQSLIEATGTCPSVLRAFVPLTLDNDLRHTGNAVSMALVNMPGGRVEFADRIAAARDELHMLGHARSELALPAVARLSATLPWPAQCVASRATMAIMAPDMHIGINPGHVKLKSVLDRPVSGIYPLSPLLGNALSFTCMVLSSGVHIGIVWDPDAVGDQAGASVAEHLGALLPQSRVFAAIGQD